MIRWVVDDRRSATVLCRACGYAVERGRWRRHAGSRSHARSVRRRRAAFARDPRLLPLFGWETARASGRNRTTVQRVDGGCGE